MRVRGAAMKSGRVLVGIEPLRLETRWPRGLRREEAAHYVGVSPSKFDELVSDRRMPQPREIDRRLVWDVRELDAAFDDLPRRGQPDNIPPEQAGWDDYR
jgi:predicted DNA-binding transcriptional regulator AlpA